MVASMYCHLLPLKRSCLQQHGFQMVAVASTRLHMCQTPQKTAEMNPSHYVHVLNYQVPYSAKLISVFADGKTKRRLIRGTYVETLLTDVEIEYLRPFYTRNGTRSPTTPSTTSTTARTTTTNSPMALKARVQNSL